MDAATAVMGCSPGLPGGRGPEPRRGGAAEGLDPEQAYELVLESFAGTIELLRRYDPIEVRSAVASPRRGDRGGARGARRRRVPATPSRPPSARRWSGCAHERPSRSPAATSPTTSARCCFVYTVLIFVNVLLSWVGQFRPIPYNLTLRAVTGFVEETHEPVPEPVPGLVPRIGPLDISPIIAIIALSIVGGARRQPDPRVSVATRSRLGADARRLRRSSCRSTRRSKAAIVGLDGRRASAPTSRSASTSPG